MTETQTFYRSKNLNHEDGLPDSDYQENRLMSTWTLRLTRGHAELLERRKPSVQFWHNRTDLLGIAQAMADEYKKDNKIEEFVGYILTETTPEPIDEVAEAERRTQEEQQRIKEAQGETP